MAIADQFPADLQDWLDAQAAQRGVEWLYCGDAQYSAITTKALSEALEGFALGLAPDTSIEWLARAVRRALACTTPTPTGFDLDYAGNAPAKSRLLTLAQRAADLASDLEGLSEQDRGTVFALMNETSREHYLRGIGGVKLVAVTLETVGKAIKVERAKWKSSAARLLRVRQAHYLSPVFQIAFDREPSVNDRDGASLGLWADFYQRVIDLATGERLTRDRLREALKEGRRRHKATPVIYPAGFFAP